MMRIATVYILSLAFVFSIFSSLSYAQSELDSAFLRKYHGRYEVNAMFLHFVIWNAIKECQKKCSKKDIEIIKKLADHGDIFAQSILPGVLMEKNDLYAIEKFNELSIVYADKGIPFAMIIVMSNNYRKNQALAMKYALSLKNSGYYIGYVWLTNMYFYNNDAQNFCAIGSEVYKKYGIMFMARYFASPTSPVAQFFYSNCTKRTPEKILSQAGQKGFLLKGYSLIHANNYEAAYKEFSKLYKLGDDSQLSANAGYCLGMMNYYGKGIAENKTEGRKLLKEAFDNGVVYWETPEQVEFDLPAKLEIISYPESNCPNIK